MNKLRVGVVGIGFWGRNHVRILSELPEVELISICDVDKLRTDQIVEEYGFRTYNDSRKMYKKEDLDAVTICVWSTRLAEEAAFALNAGKHVLIEKPMANSTNEARKILKIAESKKLLIAVGFIERFNPGVKRVKETIEKGEIGVPVSAIVKRVSKWPQRIGDVGVVKDTAIHDIDVARYIFNEDPVSVYAKTGSLRHEKFEDYAQIMLTFSGGKTAFIEANWLTPYKIRKLTVTGSEAIVNLDYITQEMSLETSAHTITPRHDFEEPLKLELEHFVNCVLSGNKPLVSGVDGLRALEIAESAMKSSKKNRIVEMKE